MGRSTCSGGVGLGLRYVKQLLSRKFLWPCLHLVISPDEGCVVYRSRFKCPIFLSPRQTFPPAKKLPTDKSWNSYRETMFSQLQTLTAPFSANPTVLMTGKRSWISDGLSSTAPPQVPWLLLSWNHFCRLEVCSSFPKDIWQL